MKQLVALVLLALGCQAADFDVLIRNARIVDGSGNPWFRADIGIAGGKIEIIGVLAVKTAQLTIAAGGQDCDAHN